MVFACLCNLKVTRLPAQSQSVGFCHHIGSTLSWHFGILFTYIQFRYIGVIPRLPYGAQKRKIICTVASFLEFYAGDEVNVTIFRRLEFTII